MGAASDEFDPLGVVVHGVEHSSQRRSRECVQQRGAEVAIDRDQAVDLDLRPEGDTCQRHADHPVAQHAALAAEDLGDHQRHCAHPLSHARRDHGKRRAAAAGCQAAQQRSKGQACGAAHQRNQADRQRQLAGAHAMASVHRHESARAALRSGARSQRCRVPSKPKGLKTSTSTSSK
jgi:hypothetical protein